MLRYTGQQIASQPYPDGCPDGHIALTDGTFAVEYDHHALWNDVTLDTDDAVVACDRCGTLTASTAILVETTDGPWRDFVRCAGCGDEIAWEA